MRKHPRGCSNHKWIFAGWYNYSWHRDDDDDELFTKDKASLFKDIPPYVYCETCGDSPKWYMDVIYREIMKGNNV